MFEIAHPLSLLLLPIPLCIWFFCPIAKTQFPSSLRVPFYQTLQVINQQKPSPKTISHSMYLLLFIWSLLVVALAGPRWVGKPLPLTREGHNIMLALDLSPSMEVRDMIHQGQATSRLSVVKQAAAQFVKDRSDDKIGLILFGSKAYLQTPLTYDHQNVLMRLDDATVGLTGQSTSIGDALGLAVKRLQDVPAGSRVIILLTDGANNSGVLTPLKAAGLAQLDGIKVYTIGLGAQPDAQTINGAFMSVTQGAELDENTLKKVAKKTGGRYFRATDLKSLRDIYQTINEMETSRHDEIAVRPQYDYYPWLVALALLSLLVWFAHHSRLFHTVLSAIGDKRHAL